MSPDKINCLLSQFDEQLHIIEKFMRGVVDAFQLEPSLCKGDFPVIHTIKSRVKNRAHLHDKLKRVSEREEVRKDDLFDIVNDLAGVRILHLYQDQFKLIHEHIMRQVDLGDWKLVEPPVAYSWDPELNDFFVGLDLNVKIKDSYYTSIHYVVKPPTQSKVSCEIQVRTLFEEIWGEIDHSINYPYKTDNIACIEQIRVLSKLVSTGTRLATAIYRVNDAGKNF